jgi:hypothetical protein
MEAKHKHLDFIQLTITRMAANSFLLKGWCVTLIAALWSSPDKNCHTKRRIQRFRPHQILTFNQTSCDLAGRAQNVIGIPNAKALLLHTIHNRFSFDSNF